uniref:GTP cyclohydrolase 1 n=1 Tax=Chlorobium chlorochromatii (strain CaD3) TaxID=340177 RepID=GCH1_CHLCH|nr:RecName: Full=GTP cyclohydrolase 1; AltName: Full=GTP cyclohydrolase I; Short=GTP-CH-I [Chlorobium chlorochromatii CaD3]
MKQEKTPSAITENKLPFSSSNCGCGCHNDDDTLTHDDGLLTDNLESAVYTMLQNVGEDPQREGLLKTPERVARSMRFLTKGYHENPEELLQKALFTESYDEMVLVRDIDLFSMCEHHMLPFFGKAHVAYIPDGKIVGLSKLARVVEVFSRRLQVQERLTQQIRDAIQNVLNPKGVAVVIEAKHLCMVMRGVEKLNSITTTSAMSGVFMTSPSTRGEFLRLIQK